MRIGDEFLLRVRHSHRFQHLHAHLFRRFFILLLLMHHHRFHHLCPDGVYRRQACHRLLEDHGNILAAQLSYLFTIPVSYTHLKDYDKWHAFIQAVIEHLKERYGEKEIETWYFELWNEPDIFYWKGTSAEYCKLYDYTEDAVHAAAPNLRLSGPAVTGIFKDGHAEKFFRFFLEHCKNGANFCTGEKGTRLDFITFHVKGGGFPFQMHAPKAVPSVESLVHQVKLGLDIITEFGYQNCEVVLSEADPDGWAAGGVYDNANMIFRNTE